MPENRDHESEPSFVFVGQVLAQGAATLDAVQLDAGTLVVGVVQTIASPEAVGPLDGFEITVQLQPEQQAEVGKTYLFRADGWLFGDSLAVTCRDLEDPTAEHLAATQEAIVAKPLSALKQRAANAEMIVAGRVTQVKEVRRPKGAPITEHDPEWLEATIAVDSVEGSGDVADAPRNVKIRFAASHDADWHQAPKFAVGDQAVWLLGDKRKSEAMRSLSGAPSGQYTVTEGADCLDLESLGHLRQILKEGE
jgi:hypothetical protein